MFITKTRAQILGPEKLRGVGGLLLGADGRRFADELATRDVLAATMMAQPQRRAFIVLGEASAALFGPAIQFYEGKKLLARAPNCAAAAAAMGVPPAALEEELRAYNAAAAAGRDEFGKTVFPALVDPEGGEPPPARPLPCPLPYSAAPAAPLTGRGLPCRRAVCGRCDACCALLHGRRRHRRRGARARRRRPPRAWALCGGRGGGRGARPEPAGRQQPH
jgi:hypothetical protein